MLKTTTLRHLEIEKDDGQLIKRCKQHGWYCRKFRAPGNNGVSDRNGGTKRRNVSKAEPCFLELKRAVVS